MIIIGGIKFKPEVRNTWIGVGDFIIGVRYARRKEGN